MERIAKFEKVSLEQYKLDLEVENVEEVYNSISLPKRATAASAGYDFYLPYDVVLKPNTSIKVKTGIRCKMDNSWVLQIFPRSSLGFKFRVQLDNTVGIIDADYYNAQNEGHIIIKIANDGYEGKDVVLKAGSGFAQGIFLQYGITVDDDVETERTGGFGSTDKK